MKTRTPLTPGDVADQLAVIRLRAESVAQGLTPAQFNWQPADGGWSIGQCFDHIVRSNIIYLGAVNAAIAAAPRRPDPAESPAKPDFFGGWFASTMEPPVGRRFRSPTKSRPASALDADETRRRFSASLDDIQRCAGEAWRIDLNRTRFRNPFVRGFRLFNVAAAIAILLAHTRRHLWQAEQVKASPGFPS